jgi:hypothetical protein
MDLDAHRDAFTTGAGARDVPPPPARRYDDGAGMHGSAFERIVVILACAAVPLISAAS